MKRTFWRRFPLLLCLVVLLSPLIVGVYTALTPRYLAEHPGEEYFLQSTPRLLGLDEKNFCQELAREVGKVKGDFMTYDPYGGMSVFAGSSRTPKSGDPFPLQDHVLISSNLWENSLYKEEDLKEYFQTENLYRLPPYSLPERVTYVRDFTKAPFVGNRWIVSGSEEVQTAFQEVFKNHHLVLEKDSLFFHSFGEQLSSLYTSHLIELYLGGSIMALVILFSWLRDRRPLWRTLLTGIGIFTMVLLVLLRGSFLLLLPAFLGVGLAFALSNTYGHSRRAVKILCASLAFLFFLYPLWRSISYLATTEQEAPQGAFLVMQSPQLRGAPVEKLASSLGKNDIFIPRAAYVVSKKDGQVVETPADVLLTSSPQATLLTEDGAYHHASEVQVLMKRGEDAQDSPSNNFFLKDQRVEVMVPALNEFEQIMKENGSTHLLVVSQADCVETAGLLRAAAWVRPSLEDRDRQALLQAGNRERVLFVSPRHEFPFFALSLGIGAFLGMWVCGKEFLHLTRSKKRV